MMKSFIFKTLLLLNTINQVYAGNISLNIETNPELSPHHLIFSKQLEFELIELSQKSRLAIIKQMTKPRLKTEATKLPNKIKLGMANVPVLDQGRHGSCVTFAVTAALDALDNLGDYYSQLCFLQLGSYLFQQGMGSSGWDGLNGYTALKRIDDYGLMNKQQEQKKGCGGLNAYPSYKSHTGEMSIEEYHLYAKNPRFTYRTIFEKSEDKTNLIKQSLNAGHRLLVGVLLPKVDLGTAGAVGWHSYFNDTWVLTDEIKNALKTNQLLPGHMLVITGYDDTLIARDTNGKAHKGLFILRNSWGSYVGDSGTFYMSYDYMNALAHSAFELKVPVA